MIDLTAAINNAFTNIDRFDVQLWYDVLRKFVADEKLTFCWDEDDDLWINIDQGKTKVIMVSRAFPFLFVMKNFENYLDLVGYCDNDFIKVVITSWLDEDYKINLDGLVSGSITWNTNVVDTNKFSINDFFYATH
jgi:hypothetical protein